MFNDVLNVQALDDERKKALQKLMQRMQANQQRASGLAGMNRAGGGLGNQQAARFRPLALRNLGALARIAPGQGRGPLGAAVSRFGIVQRQPGAFDPGAIPDLGGVPATMGAEAPVGAPGVSAPAAGGGNQFYQPQDSGDQYAGRDPGSVNTAQQQAAGGDPEAARFLSGQSDISPFSAQPTQNAGNGYVMYQGVPIPLAIFKAMQIGDLGA